MNVIAHAFIISAFVLSLLGIAQCNSLITTDESQGTSSPITFTAIAEDQFNEKDLVRNKRSTTKKDEQGKHSPKVTKLDSEFKPDITPYELKDPHQQVMVDWAGERSQVVICLTKDSIQRDYSTSNIYISYDYGSSFVNKTHEFKLHHNKLAVIAKFYKNEKFTSQFIFADTLHKYLFITTDYGHTIRSHKLEFVPSDISTHPTDPLIIAAHDTIDKILWITTDLGESWIILQQSVKSYFWSDKVSPTTLYVSRENNIQRNTVFAYNSFSQENGRINFQHSISNVYEFLAKDEFLFLVRKKKSLLGAKTRDTTLELSISYRGGPFWETEFPNNLTHQNYYVADVSNGQIMICVFHGISSNLYYVSSFPTSPEEKIRFSLSLERIFYFTPSTNWNNTWLNEVAEKSFADVHRVKGVRGVFIASQLYENYTKSNNKLGPEHLLSRITFDSGGEWAQLKPPTNDIDGHPSKCKLEKGCSLHISQELSRLYPSTQSRQILTSKSAPGIILATGTLGTSLKGHLGVFLSSDAGASWHHVLKGHHIYTIGDHGGIFMAVQLYHFTGETDNILFSIDEGATWHYHKFYSEKLRVYGLMTEPGENTTIFSLYGSKPEKHEWIIVKIDMAPIFEKQCGKDDYKTWIPFDTFGMRRCLLGSKEVFERRNPHSKCFNGMDYDRPISVENCPCTREDYECDFGYKINGPDTTDCAKDVNSTANFLSQPLGCRTGQFYNRTKGYKKIPGDMCVGGRDFQFEPERIHCSLAEESEFLLVSSREHILRYDLLQPEKGLQPIPVEGLDSAVALEFSMKTNCLYWSNVNTKKIMRQCFDGHHGLEVVAEEDLDSVEGLALDWVSDNLYFVDGPRKVIEVLKLSPVHKKRFRKVILDSKTLDVPRGIAIHPVQGLMFFTDWSKTKPMVARANLDGSNTEVLFDSAKVTWPNGITIDFKDSRIYFADAKLDYIASAFFDGSHFVKIIDKNDFVIQPFAVAVHKSILYWDDWKLLQILQADKERGWGAAPLTTETVLGLVDLKVFGGSTQVGSNACGSNTTSTCKYMCIGRPDNAFACVCPPWLEAKGDDPLHMQCLCPGGREPSDAGDCPSVASTCSPNFFQCDSKMCIPKSMVCDTEDDCGDYSDERNCTVRRCDAPSWSCDNGHCISPAWRCDGDNDCGDNSDEDRCVNKSCSVKQFKCNNEKCVNKDWLCDMQDDCGDGSDEANCTFPSYSPERCRNTEFSCGNSSSSSGAALQCIPMSWRCDREDDCKDGSDETDCAAHRCGNWQFQCPQGRCIYNTWVCDGDSDCQDGADEANCTDVPGPMPPFPPPNPFIPTATPPRGGNTTCSVTDFKCDNGNCILFLWRCDFADDCGDGSDEFNCGFGPFGPDTTTVTPSPSTLRPPNSERCKIDQMECPEGKCLWQSWVCDGTKDCANGEDEENCSDKVSCSALQFRCWRSEGCIPRDFVCNNRSDCADGSDEFGCDAAALPSTVAPSCPTGFFECDGGQCLSNFRKCDANPDCFDMTDEDNCTTHLKTYQVQNLQLRLVTNTSASVKWDLEATVKPPGVSFEFLPSYVTKAAYGNRHAWMNATWTNETIYTITELQPYTSYKLKVYIREKESKMEYMPRHMMELTTAVGVPSPPTNVSLGQVGSELQVTWDPPLRPNGKLKVYHIYLFSSNYPKPFEVDAAAPNAFRIPILHTQEFQVSMTASNSEFTSLLSPSKGFRPLSVDEPVSGLKVSSLNSSYALVTWKPLGGDVDGYAVTYTFPENEYVGASFRKNVTTNQIELNNLAPGLRYVVEVRGVKGDIVGPLAVTEIITKGAQLPAVMGIRPRVYTYPGTLVLLSWDPVSYVEEHVWQYRILYGRSERDLRDGKNVVTTTNTTTHLRVLDACEAYIVVAMISGPIGTGPVNTSVAFRTKEDPLAPPKSVRARTEGKDMIITWAPSCPQSPDKTIKYMLNITEKNLGKSTFIEVPTNASSVEQNHRVAMHIGGQYNVIVRTSLPGSIPSVGTPVSAPGIPSPYELTYHQQTNSFFWRIKKDVPIEILDKGFSYILYLSLTDINGSSVAETRVEVDNPPYVADGLLPGRIYLASVAFKDKDGYLSSRSISERVEKPIGDSLVIAKSNAVGVAVAVIVVIALLVGLVTVLVFRHRRLARSFLTFANTHYDRSQGATVITSDHNLDDDDSPMIRGFSDDEPLVIA